jgi:hypothetical protein
LCNGFFFCRVYLLPETFFHRIFFSWLDTGT